MVTIIILAKSVTESHDELTQKLTSLGATKVRDTIDQTLFDVIAEIKSDTPENTISQIRAACETLTGNITFRYTGVTSSQD